MKKEQLVFTLLEARAVCEMLISLIEDGYSIQIMPGVGHTTDGKPFVSYDICVMDNDSNEVTKNAGYRLIDALSDAYSMVPENDSLA